MGSAKEQFGRSLLQLAILLRWRAEPAALVELCNSFDQHLDAASTSPEFANAVGPSVIKGLSQLLPDARAEFLRSPQVIAQLTGCRRDQLGVDRARFAEMVLAELAYANLVQHLPISVWRARGDIRFVTGSHAHHEEAASWLIVGRTAVDDKSPQMFPYDGKEQKLLLPLEDDDSLRVKKLLADSLELLASTSPSAANFVSVFIRQVSIRFEPGAPESFNSSSFSHLIGLALLVNPHLSSVDTLNLIDSLVHEAIHSMLYMIEELTGPFVLAPPSLTSMLTSPWTGATLTLHAYVHACLVWYGLFWLWTDLEQASALPRRLCEKFRKRALLGFERAPLSQLVPYRRDLSGRVLELLAAMMIEVSAVETQQHLA